MRLALDLPLTTYHSHLPVLKHHGEFPVPYADEWQPITPVPTLMNDNLSSPHADESIAIFPVPTLMNGNLSSPHADELQSFQSPR
jgi:hypothetical protein